MRQHLNDMNPNAKKNKKIKDLLKNVKKIEDGQMENITELVNKIYIQRHKLKMIWFMINRTVEQAKEKGIANEDEQEESKEEESEKELTEEQKLKLEMEEA